VNRISWVLVVALALVLLACTDRQPTVSENVVSPTAASITAVADLPTATTTPSFTPTAMATSTNSVQVVSPTATPTLTPTPLPIYLPQLLLTPAPPPEDSTAYRLIPWSRQQAESLPRLMERYYTLMGQHFALTSTESIYRDAFIYAGLAYQEDQLRYPDDPRVSRWQLAEIAHRAASNDPHSTRLYQEALLEALQTEKTPLSEEALIDWFEQYPLFFSISIHHLPPLDGFTAGHIVTIASRYEVGGASFWVLEKENRFTVYPIYSNLGNYGAATYETHLADLTGNRVLEFIVYAPGRSDAMSDKHIAIYDLSRFPPANLSFGPDMPWSIHRADFVSVTSEPTNGSFLQIRSGGERFACPSSFTGTFAWNGQWLEQVSFTVGEWTDDDAICISNLDWTLENNIWSASERAIILHSYESEFGDTPPPGNHWLYDQRDLSPQEFQQEIRYILAMNHALLGNVEETVGYLSLITEGEWLEPAQRFLGQYETPVDTYRACNAAGVKCDPRQALARTVASLPPANGETILAQLVELGVPIVDSGLFDADRNQTPEYWFTVQHPGRDTNELWLLAQSDTGVKPLFIDTFSEGTPRLRNHSGWTIASVYGSTPGYFLFSVGVTDEIYAFVRRLTDQEPYVIKLEGHEPWLPPTHPQAAVLDEAVDDLLANGDPAVAIERLLVLADMPEFEPTARYYYYLGLAYELAADETNAVINYWLAWQDCCVVWEFGGIEDELVTPNPFALMARAKLEPNGE
jgi:hypothetical protein